MTFNFKADITFDAKDLDDALEKLSKHFATINENETWFIGEMILEPNEK